MNAQAVGDRIVVKIINREDRTESGILLYRPDSKEPEHAEVLVSGRLRSTEWVTRSAKPTVAGTRSVDEQK